MTVPPSPLKGSLSGRRHLEITRKRSNADIPYRFAAGNLGKYFRKTLDYTVDIAVKKFS
jgi:hypothetical protein